MINNENFITIQGWMRNELGLKGNELLTYAVIYGFSQTQGNLFTGSASYIADWCGIKKRQTFDILKKLADKGLIVKHERETNGVKFCDYEAIPFNAKIAPPMQCFTPPVQKLHGGDAKIAPHNIEYNIDLKRTNIIDIGEKKADKSAPSTQIVNCYVEVQRLYNNICVSYPKCSILSEARKKAINARLTLYSMEQFEEMFRKAEASDFLKGSNNRNWKANFDWLLCDRNFARVLEGNYDNKTSANPQSDYDKFMSETKAWLESEDQ